MANSDSARGLKPVRHISGAPFSGSTNRYYVPSSDGTAIYVGGLVKFGGTADARGVASVTGNVATGDAVVGVVVAVMAETRDALRYREASTARYVQVADDPNTLFEVQEDSVGAAMAVTAVGNVADLASFTAGSTSTAASAIEIDSSSATASGDGTEDVLIVGLADREDNDVGTNAKWLVRLNNHAFVDANTGA